MAPKIDDKNAPANAPVTNSPGDSNWRRLPRPGARLAGLSRTTWNELCDGGKVKSVTIRKPHAQRGIKLIFWPSAESYLQSLMDGCVMARKAVVKTQGASQ